MKRFLLLYSLLFTTKILATAYDPKLPDHGVMSLDFDGFLDPSRDYTSNVGRVSDVHLDRKMFKVQVESDTTRFLKAGDIVNVSIPNLSKGECEVSVVTTEVGYVTFGWQSLEKCWEPKKYFRRGLVVNLYSTVMQLRVQQASAYRKQLLERRSVYMKQLNDVNNFFWKYENEREKLLNEYDQRINALKNEKLQTVSGLDEQRVSKTKVQGELMQELNSLDELLKFYRIERKEVLTDRFYQDYDTSAPVDQRGRTLQ